MNINVIIVFITKLKLCYRSLTPRQSINKEVENEFRRLEFWFCFYIISLSSHVYSSAESASIEQPITMREN